MDKVTVRRHNEVHFKVDCEPGLLMEIAGHFTFEVPGAKFSPAYRNRVWDGKIRLLNPLTRLLYCGLIHQLEQFCKSREYELELDGDFGDTEFSLLEAESFINKLEPKHRPRDYQIEAFVHGVRKRRALLLSPTGSGKSLIIYLLACYYRTKTLIIVPTTSLVHQMASDFEDYGLPKGMVHKIMSGEEKNPTYHIFTLENGNKYTFEGNEYIRLINSNVRQKLAKDITTDDDIDDRWLEGQTGKQIL